jgi:3-oxoacyl-[acyl-carrier-protein] synthase-1
MSGAAPTISVAAIGAFSPLGPTWVQTCASIRAGLNRLAQHPYYELVTADPGWDPADPLRCSAVPGWNEALDEPERLTAMALEALRDLLAVLRLRRANLEAGGLLLALPTEAEVPGVRDARRGVVGQLVERTGLDGFRIAEPRDGDRTGFFLALQEACSRIHSGELEFCIVGGVDSYLFDQRLDGLDAAWRLRSARNPDGFLPVEAAALLLLCSPRSASVLGRTLCTFGTVGIGHEAQTAGGDRSSTGIGLCKAITAALGVARPGWILCDLNGESYRAFEWGLARVRLGSSLEQARALTHPADCVGDVGAATGALLVACAAHGFARAAAPAGPALLWTAADDVTRAAVLVHPPTVRKA